MEYEIISVVLGVIAIVAGVKWRGLKNLLKTVSDAIEDDEITAEEAREIVKVLLELAGKGRAK